MENTLKGTPRDGLIAATWGFFLGFAALAVYGPLAKQMKEIMHLSGFLLGVLVAVPQLTGSLLRIPFGAWADSSGGRRPFLWLLSISAIGIAGLVTTFIMFYPEKFDFTFYPVLLIFGIMCGCGVATFSVGIAQTSYWFSQNKQGYALGLYAGIGNSAAGVFILIVPVLFNQMGIVGTYLIWLALLVVGIAVYAIFARDAYYFQLIHRGIPNRRSYQKGSGTGTGVDSIGEAEKIIQELLEKYTLHYLIVYHSLGKVGVNQIPVVVCTGALHRNQALSACHEAINMIKQRLPIWGLEITQKGQTVWKINTP
ncbi:MAG: MFS transporter [Bacteroidales bacterium]